MSKLAVHLIVFPDTSALILPVGDKYQSTSQRYRKYRFRIKGFSLFYDERLLAVSFKVMLNLSSKIYSRDKKRRVKKKQKREFTLEMEFKTDFNYSSILTTNLPVEKERFVICLFCTSY